MRDRLFKTPNSNPAEFIRVVGLNRGTITRWRKQVPSVDRKQQIERLLAKQGGAIPGAPGFRVSVAAHNGAATATVSRAGEDVLTCGLAVNAIEARGLWVWLVDFRAFLLGRKATEEDYKSLLQPDSFPWIAEFVHSAAKPVTREEAFRLSVFLRELVFVLVGHDSEKRN